MLLVVRNRLVYNSNIGDDVPTVGGKVSLIILVWVFSFAFGPFMQYTCSEYHRNIFPIGGAGFAAVAHLTNELVSGVVTSGIVVSVEVLAVSNVANEL